MSTGQTSRATMILAVAALAVALSALGVAVTALTYVIDMRSDKRKVVVENPPATVTTAAPPGPTITPLATNSAHRPASPFPLQGERIEQLIPPNRLDDGQSSGPMPEPRHTAKPHSAGPHPAVPWDHAGRYVGQTITVEGTIVDTGKTQTGLLVFLNFQHYRPGSDAFYVVLYKEAQQGWPLPPAQYFLGKTIRVTGEVSLHNARPQIKVHDPQRIQVIE